MEGHLNAGLRRSVEATDGRIVLGDVDWDLLANLDVDWAPEPCDVGSGVLVEPGEIWADSGYVLFHHGTIYHGNVVDFGVSQHRLWEMELPVVVLVAPVVIGDLGFVDDLGLGGAELDEDWGLLWCGAGKACSIESDFSVPSERA